MTTTRSAEPLRSDTPGARGIDRAQYGLAAFLVVAGAFVVYDGTTLGKGFSDQPVQPNALSYVFGGVLLVLGVLLAVATARGDRAEAEDGEDLDLDHAGDWRTVSMLAGIFVLNIALISWLGWAITGALLFAGSAWVLGNRTPVRALAIGAALSVGTWYGFYSGLGIPIPPGILDGVL